MARPLSFALILILFAALSTAAQSPDTSSPTPPAQSKDSTPTADAPKPKKVWTNDNVSGAKGTVSVVGDPKSKPAPPPPKPTNAQYAASIRNQIEKLQVQIDDINKQLVDLKNFSEGEPSTSASGVKLDKSLEREPIEVQMRGLQNKKKDLQSKIDALLDEARKKGVEPGELR